MFSYLIHQPWSLYNHFIAIWIFMFTFMLMSFSISGGKFANLWGSLWLQGKGHSVTTLTILGFAQAV